MREMLRPYSGADKINFLCLVATEMMGFYSLSQMPALLSGFNSVNNTLRSDVAQALSNIRLAGFAPSTHRELVLMADNYRAHHLRLDRQRARGDALQDRLEQRYVINEDLSIRPLWAHLTPDDVAEALRCLSQPLAPRHREPMPLHSGSAAAEVVDQRGYSGFIAPLGFVPPDPELYDMQRIGKQPGKVLWADLVAIARQFDAIDVTAGRQQPGDETWFHRLHDLAGNPTAVLLEAGPSGLIPADGLDLTGMKHLIGLPGAGKTTALYLLAGYCAQRNISVCFIFPSIEVSTGFIETLGRYSVEVGLLSGQGEASRARHVLNFATALSSQNNGFGVTSPAARFFGTNCALAGFASDEESEFPHQWPPCMQIKQRPQANKRATTHRCAMSSVCGYQYAERMLATTSIWAGHILSMDRSVARLFSDFDTRHFEFIARTFDMLIVDECDGAQNGLDAKGTPIMKLVGDSESLWSTLIADIHQPAAGGRNAFVAGETLPVLLEMTGRFGRAAERMVGRIMHFPPRFRSENANILLTSLTIIADMFPDDHEDQDESARHYEARQALERIWDVTVKQVAFRHDAESHRDDDDDESVGLERVLADAAPMMLVDIASVTEFHGALLKAVELWERDGNDASVQAIAAVLRSAPSLSSAIDDESFFAYCGLLVSVSLVVLQHFGLAPHLRLLNAAGLIGQDVFESRPSIDQLAVLPESLIGRLSGVRYTVSEEGNVNVSHVGFAGTQRLLPDRMIKIGQEAGSGMAVLLTSATSMLAPSPSFHVSTGPHYVLQRPNAGDGWRNSRYTYLPQRDPQNPNVALRFSGAKMSQRDTILKAMVDSLLRGGNVSNVATAMDGNDVKDGVRRKVGFVVNSYDQCALIFEHIQANHPTWRGRVRYLTRATIHGSRNDYSVTVAEVEMLGSRRDWDLLIFPMSAIGRGVNIVFQYGPRTNRAMIGSLFFLTRPHPRGDSLQLIQGLIGRASEEFDRRLFHDKDAALAALREARKDTSRMVEYLLRMPLVAQALGKYAEPFVADQMIIILQTIGRAMRGDCPAFVYFVDAAWAPNSAKGLADDKRTSMLVMMQTILRACLQHPDLAVRQCYQNLYQTFSMPLDGIANLITAETAQL